MDDKSRAEFAKQIGKAIDAAIPGDTGYVVLLFPLTGRVGEMIEVLTNVKTANVGTVLDYMAQRAKAQLGPEGERRH